VRLLSLGPRLTRFRLPVLPSTQLASSTASSRRRTRRTCVTCSYRCSRRATGYLPSGAATPRSRSFLPKTVRSQPVVLCDCTNLTGRPHRHRQPGARPSSSRALVTRPRSSRTALSRLRRSRRTSTMSVVRSTVIVTLVLTSVEKVLLMDLSMPNMGGHEATQIIRKFERENGLGRLPIVALTAHAMLGDRENCIVVGWVRRGCSCSRCCRRRLTVACVRRRVPHQAASQAGLARHDQQGGLAGARSRPARPVSVRCGRSPALPQRRADPTCATSIFLTQP
jgi:CheY-like chemotaxis protein